MKYIIFFLFAFSKNVFADSTVKIKKITNTAFTEILAKASFKEARGKNINVRVYSLPVDGSCWAETHGVCAHKLTLATLELDTNPKAAAYDLGTWGEVVILNHESTNNGLDNFIFEINHHPADMIKNNQEKLEAGYLKKVNKAHPLENKTYRFRLTAKATSIEIVPITIPAE